MFLKDPGVSLEGFCSCVKEKCIVCLIDTFPVVHTEARWLCLFEFYKVLSSKLKHTSTHFGLETEYKQH